MSKENINLTSAEWNVMECLWEKSPCTGREAVQYLKERVSWSRSTTLTMLHRMTEKGIIKCIDNGIKTYEPLVERESAVHAETDNFINRVYKGSVSMMMSTITQKKNLSKAEIDELYAILEKAEEDSND